MSSAEEINAPETQSPEEFSAEESVDTLSGDTLSGDTLSGDTLSGDTLSTETPLLRISFGGMCSFVDDRSGDDRTVHVLMPESSRSKVFPPLCRHHRYLIFALNQLRSAKYEFYESIVGYDPFGQLTSLGLWNIDGCDIDLLPDGEFESDLDHIDYEKTGLLDLDCFNGGGIRRNLLTEPVSANNTLGARLRLRHGKLRAGPPIEPRWKMCCEDGSHCDSSTTTPGWTFCQTVEYSLSGEVSVVQIKAFNHRVGREQWINLGFRQPPSRIDESLFVTIGNLCPTPSDADRTARVERDVLAYYENIRHVPPQKDRLVPVVREDFVSPRESACPPVNQSPEGS